jgi:hypothetical protein
VGTLLRVVMYVVALAAGVDTYVVGPRFLVDSVGMSAGAAQVTAAIAGAVLALILATIPIAIYQRVMRTIVARRRAANRSAAAAEPADGWPERADAAEEPRGWAGSNHTYGVISRENRALRWPAPEPAVDADLEPVAEAPDPTATPEAEAAGYSARATQSWPGDGT